MTVQSMIAGGRTLVEDTFIDNGTITRPADGAPVLNASTAVSTPAEPTSVYSGRCRVKKPSQVEQQQVFGEVNETVMRRLINLPYDAPEVRIGDIFTGTAGLDGEIVGTPLRVVAIGSTSVLMFRQLGAEIVEP